MVNPSSNFRQEPLSQWGQSVAFDSAVECENAITYQMKKAEEEKSKFIWEQRKCVPADAVYPHSQPKK
jgi:hypothetical protein